MNEQLFSNKFDTDFNRVFGFSQMSFKINSDKNERMDIPQWRKNRTNSRSAGKLMYLHTKPSKCCGSLIRRVCNNECFDCFKLENNNG